MRRHADPPPEFFAAISRLVTQPHIELMIRPADAWYLMTALQLAIRHPAMPENIGGEIERISRRLVDLIADLEPALRPYAEAGFDRSWDVPVSHRRRR